jgi:4-diphosphocytidyl-2-C-methyl-D-erythritol kinase
MSTIRPEGLLALAPAKLNLGLEVLRRRRDGYHDIETIFQALDLYDELEFSTLKDPGRFELSVEDLTLPSGPENIVIKAHALMAARFPRAKRGTAILLRKRIPVASGLGGGSSDAAATLLALNRLWSLGLERDALEALALELGSDVPFFLRGGTAIGRGRGERLISLPPLGRGAFLLVNPGFQILSSWAYGNLKLGLTGNLYRIRVEQVKAHLSRFPAVGMVIKNRLEDAVFPAYPVFRDIAASLGELGAVHVSLSGSGATVFGTFSSREEAERAGKALGAAWRHLVASPIASGVELK